MDFTLRSAGATDAEEVASVFLASRKAFLPFAPSAHSDTEVRSWIAERLIPSRAVVVAESETRIVGMMATSTVDGGLVD